MIRLYLVLLGHPAALTATWGKRVGGKATSKGMSCRMAGKDCTGKWIWTGLDGKGKEEEGGADRKEG